MKPSRVRDSRVDDRETLLLPTAPASCLLLPVPHLLAKARVLFGEEEREPLGFENVEAAHDFGEREFVLEVDLVVEAFAHTVFVALPVLRHHIELALLPPYPRAPDPKQHP